MIPETVHTTPRMGAFIANVVFIALAVFAAALFVEACFQASEHEDCHRMKRHYDAGHPVNPPPAWCDQYLNPQHGG